MKKVVFLAGIALGLGLGLAAVPGQAQQDAAKKAAPPKPALGPSQALLEEWNDIGKRLIAMAEDIPEDKYDFKPKPEMRSWVQQLLHAAYGNYYFLNPATGKPIPQQELPDGQFKTRAEVVAYVKKVYAEGAELIKSKGDAGMAETMQMGRRMWRFDALAYDLIAHANEHYGQIVVYYRLNGIVPPESRPRK
jgi:uncharacterized damage-inducible protein DinB